MRRFLPHETKILGFYKAVERQGTQVVIVESETMMWRLKAKCGVLVKMVNREYERDNTLMEDAKRAVDSVGIREVKPKVVGGQWGLEFYRREDEPDIKLLDSARMKIGEGEYDPVEDAGAKSLEAVLKKLQTDSAGMPIVKNPYYTKGK